MTPLGDRVLLDIEEEAAVTSTGFILPEKKDNKLERATVIALGDECVGKVAVGDKVVIKGYSYDTITLDSKEYSFAKEEDILAIWNTTTTIA